MGYNMKPQLAGRAFVSIRRAFRFAFGNRESFALRGRRGSSCVVCYVITVIIVEKEITMPFSADRQQESERVSVRGARTHNLKSVNLEIPYRRITSFCGVSGSGKSSLAFDVLYAEGQRRYLECLSPHVRQKLELMDKPEVFKDCPAIFLCSVSQAAFPAILQHKLSAVSHRRSPLSDSLLSGFPLQAAPLLHDIIFRTGWPGENRPSGAIRSSCGTAASMYVDRRMSARASTAAALRSYRAKNGSSLYFLQKRSA